MVEEMYLEEIKEHEQNGSEDKSSKSDHNEDSASKSLDKSPLTDNQDNVHTIISMSTSSTSPIAANLRNQSGFSLIGSSELEGFTTTQASPKKPRNNEMLPSPGSVPSINMDVKPGGEDNNSNSDQMSIKFGNERQGRDGYPFMGNQMNFIQGFGQYPIGEIARFDADQFTPRFSGNGVSLTLGLPHCENLTLSATHQSFLPNQNIQLGRRVEMGEPNEFGAINTSAPHSSAAYETINIQNGKGFAAQLLPDFVA